MTPFSPALKREGSKERRPFLRAALALGCAGALVAGVSGCGYWFGDEEVLLPGERISLRRVEAPTAASGDAVLPATVTVNDWPQSGGNSRRAVGHAAGDFALTRAWSASVGASSDSESRVAAPPVAAGGRVFALDAAARVRAISLNGGSEIWTTDLTPEDEDGRDGFGGGLAIAGDILVAATGFGQVVGLSTADGSELWRYQAASPYRAAPAVSRGYAVAISRDGQVVGLDVKTGERQWSVVGVEGGAAMLGGGAPAIAGEIVAAPFASGDLTVFRLTDGRRGWSEGLGSARRGAAITLISDVSSAPVMQNRTIYAGSVSGRLAAFEGNSGRRFWSRDIGSYNRVWAADQTIFVLAEDGALSALESKTGKTIWTTALPQFEDPEDRQGILAYGGPTLAGGKLFVVSSDEKIYRIDAKTGGIEKEADLPAAATIEPIVAGGYLLVLDENANLHAFR